MCAYAMAVPVIAVVALAARLPRLSGVLEKAPFCCWEVCVCAFCLFEAAYEVVRAYQSGMTLPEVAIGLDGMVTVVHLVLPIRWCVLFSTDVLLVLGFVARFLMPARNPGDSDLYAVMLFALLVAFASVGLRSLEAGERVLFAAVLDERTLRVRAEGDQRRPTAIRVTRDASTSQSTPCVAMSRPSMPDTDSDQADLGTPSPPPAGAPSGDPRGARPLEGRATPSPWTREARPCSARPRKVS